MKKWIAVVLLFSSFHTYAQSFTSKKQFTGYPETTPVGKPEGKLVSKVIGVSGGSIASDDGRVQLVFPQGALSANTTISIQPTPNMRGGWGKAYQFEPTGTQFKKPVKIIFSYTNEDIDDCPADLKSFALQDHTGKWTSHQYIEWDSISNKLSGYIEHFSALVTAESDVMLTPDENEIPVNGSAMISVFHRDLVDTGQWAGQNEFAEFAGDKVGVFVNGDKDGNDLVGNARLTMPAIVYDAPRILPQQNPVEIKLGFKYYSRIKKKIVWGTAKCKIAIYDKYKIEIEHKSTGRGSMNSEIRDKASFVVIVNANGTFEIENPQNEPPTVLKEGKNGVFKEKINTSGAKGTIHIPDNCKNGKLSKDYPKEVYFEFNTPDILMCSIKHGAKGIWGESSELYVKSIPEEINFIANDKKQTYNVTTGSGDTYKLIVTPVRAGPQ